jgi:hypothetical protein
MSRRNGVAWFVLEEGDWCLKPLKVEDMKSAVAWRKERETNDESKKRK